jgi:hypothetical protein
MLWRKQARKSISKKKYKYLSPQGLQPIQRRRGADEGFQGLLVNLLPLAVSIARRGRLFHGRTLSKNRLQIYARSYTF